MTKFSRVVLAWVFNGFVKLCHVYFYGIRELRRLVCRFMICSITSDFGRKLRLLAKYCSGNTSAAERAELLGTIFHLFCLTPEVIRGGRCNRAADEFRAREISLRKSVGINTLFY